MMRIGVLGAAVIAPPALVRPAKKTEGVEVAAIAAREPARARAFAGRHGIPTVHDSYAELLADPSIDAVYVPLPNGLHARWVLAAIEAGKHVLCEKPLTSNAEQAVEVADAAENSDRVVMEAFHYRYHPSTERMLDIVHNGEVGRVRRIETSMCIPMPRFSNIRYDFDLAGGALMDAGCYAVHCLRQLAGAEPVVTSATAVPFRRDPRIDRAIRATFRLSGDATGQLHASLWSSTLLRIRARVVGERGTMTADNFVVPMLPLSGITVKVNGHRRRERIGGEATYSHQLRAFAAAARGEATNRTPPSDSIATMRLIDDIYTAAGLPLRP